MLTLCGSFFVNCNIIEIQRQCQLCKTKFLALGLFILRATGDTLFQGGKQVSKVTLKVSWLRVNRFDS